MNFPQVNEFDAMDGDYLYDGQVQDQLKVVFNVMTLPVPTDLVCPHNINLSAFDQATHNKETFVVCLRPE